MTTSEPRVRPRSFFASAYTHQQGRDNAQPCNTRASASVRESFEGILDLDLNIRKDKKRRRLQVAPY